MKYFQEIAILEDAETPATEILSRVYMQLHLGFAELQKEGLSYGMSFPGYDAKTKQLGDKIRVFASSQDELLKLNIRQRLIRLSDYSHVRSIRPVPEKKTYAIYRRVRILGWAHLEKRAKSLYEHRLQEGVEVDYNDIIAMYKEKFKPVDLPKVCIKSLSNMHYFPFYVERLDAQEERNEGFGTYGLSAVSTVPEF